MQLVCGNQSVATLNPMTEVTIVRGGFAATEKIYRLGKELHWTDVEMAGVLGTSPKIYTRYVNNGHYNFVSRGLRVNNKLRQLINLFCVSG